MSEQGQERDTGADRDLGPDDPRTVGDYTITGRLGEGGMGRVYRGRSPGGRPVAVKVARAGLSADEGFRARFRSEIAAARQVGGFHTAQVVDADPDADPPWMVTAFVPGRDLGRTVAEDGPLDAPALYALGASLAEALTAIHGCGVIHRDLKPGNVIMSDDGPRVLDFGIAHALYDTRLTHTGTVIGTAGFLAPEQIEQGTVGPACDVFALGAVLVHAAGGHAFGEGPPMSLLYRAVHAEPDLTAVPDALRGTVAACLAKDPADRPTAAGLLAELRVHAPVPVAGPRRADAPAPPVADPVRAPAAAPAGPAAAPAPTAVAAPGAVVFEATPGRKLTGVVGSLIGALSAGFVTLGSWQTQYTENDAGASLRLWAPLVLAAFALRIGLALARPHTVTVGAAGLTVRSRRGTHKDDPVVTIPWADVIAVSRPPVNSGSGVKLLLKLRWGAPLPLPRQGVEPRSPDWVTVTVPRPMGTATTSLRKEVREAVARCAPHVHVDYL
ncbi:serine/threonine-protein kinase [Streptomyces sp. NPDC101115]|uniref:serine/threonine-protein kinase n=1 Tax=Streptomyces sp. NPDC101115 TaxID=3366106 RepID=UPI0037F4CAC9